MPPYRLAGRTGYAVGADLSADAVGNGASFVKGFVGDLVSGSDLYTADVVSAKVCVCVWGGLSSRGGCSSCVCQGEASVIGCWSLFVGGPICV